MEKKTFEEPVAEVMHFDSSDITCTSGCTSRIEWGDSTTYTLDSCTTRLIGTTTNDLVT